MTTPTDLSPPLLPRPRVFFALSAVCWVFFFGWTRLALGEGRLFVFDQTVAQHWQQHGIVRLWGTMVLFTELGSVGTNIVLAIMGALWQSSHRRRFLSLAWVGIVVGGGLLNVLLKTNLDRPRPPELWRDRAVLETNQSFPSGHAMGGVIGYGMLGYVLVLSMRTSRHRFSVLLFTATVVLAIGFSRIYLRAHWFSDVVGGYSVGLAWLFLCIGLLERRRTRLAAVPVERMQIAP